MLQKRISHAFGKDIFLLGVDANGENAWLEAPKWDCGWYWGFGYVERYTNNNNPEKAKDISSHTHIDSEFKHNDVINVNKGLKQTTYTIEEGVKLNQLFTEFYVLQTIAAKEKGNDLAKKINDVDIPAKTKEILEILTPKN